MEEIQLANISHYIMQLKKKFRSEINFMEPTVMSAKHDLFVPGGSVFAGEWHPILRGHCHSTFRPLTAQALALLRYYLDEDL